MTCREARSELRRLLLEGISLPDEVRRHLEACADCTLETERDRRLVGDIERAFREERVPPVPRIPLRRTRSLPIRRFAAAAAMLLAIASVWWGTRPEPWGRVESGRLRTGGEVTIGTGETVPLRTDLRAETAARVRLEDGTRIDLGTGARLRLLGPTGGERTVALDTGWMRCDVEPSAEPFVVRTPVREIRVMGTEFIVEVALEREPLRIGTRRLDGFVRSDRLRVDVEEGRVVVGEGVLAAEERFEAVSDSVPDAALVASLRGWALDVAFRLAGEGDDGEAEAEIRGAGRHAWKALADGLAGLDEGSARAVRRLLDRAPTSDGDAGGEIRFVRRDATGSTILYRMGPDGRQVPVTTLPDPVAWDVAPDGTRVAWMSREGGVSLLDRTAGGWTESAGGPRGWIGVPRFSRDGDRLLVAGGIQAALWDFPSARRLTVPLPHANVGGADWSPDGESIVVSRMGRIHRVPVGGGPDFPRQEDLYRLDLDTGDFVRLTGTGYTGQPVWSPDGCRIAFVSAREGNPDVAVLDLESGELRLLTRHSARDVHPAWSPDGRWIAFASDRAGVSRIYRVRADGWGAPEPLTLDGPDEGGSHMPRWLPAPEGETR